MPTLLIVYHSRTGGSRQMAEAAHDAATDTPTRLLRAQDAGPQDLIDADGYLFVAPENLAALSGEMKEFFDRCYYPVRDKIAGRAYAQMICAGSDGEGAVRQLARIAQGWRLREVCPPLIVCTNAQSPEAILAEKTIASHDLKRCREVGAQLSAGLAMGVF